MKWAFILLLVWLAVFVAFDNWILSAILLIPYLAAIYYIFTSEIGES